MECRRAAVRYDLLGPYARGVGKQGSLRRLDELTLGLSRELRRWRGGAGLGERNG
jgi:hypothetical protein